MIEAIIPLIAYFGLVGLQIYLAWRIVARNRPFLSQLGAMACVAAVAALIWYALEVKYDWSPPLRRGLQVPQPKRDAGIMFALGWLSYLQCLVNASRRRR